MTWLCLELHFLLQEIPASPFRVKVDPSHDASKVKAEGPGLSKTGETWVEMAWLVLDHEQLLQGSCCFDGYCWDSAMQCWIQLLGVADNWKWLCSLGFLLEQHL